VLVTHHVDEIPPGYGHVLLLRDGRVIAAGPIDEELTSAALSECFGIDVTLDRRNGRWSAFAS
jgi:iron complex transport system ATP-binding protein